MKTNDNGFIELTSLEYLKSDIANNFGLDKETYEVKLQWFEDNKNNLIDLIPEAEEKALFVAGIQAYENYLNDKPSGYPISLDAIASGMQFLSILSDCDKSAELCGIINNAENKRPDPYTSLYKRFCDVLGVNGKIERKHVKKAIMTALYGSESTPKKIFGEDNYPLFLKIMEKFTPKAWKLNEYLITLHDKKAIENKWVLPDNFHVIIPLEDIEYSKVRFDNNIFEVATKVNKPVDFSRAIAPNIVHSIDGFVVREIVGRCSYDIYKVQKILGFIEGKSKSDVTDKDKMVNILWNNYLNFNMLSVRILDYLTKDNIGNVDARVILNLIKSLPKHRFDVITIHDCFRVLPNYGNDLRKQYNQIMFELYNSNILDIIVSCIKEKKVKFNKQKSFGNKILNANYSIC